MFYTNRSALRKYLPTITSVPWDDLDQGTIPKDSVLSKSDKDQAGLVTVKREGYVRLYYNSKASPRGKVQGFSWTVPH